MSNEEEDDTGVRIVAVEGSSSDTKSNQIMQSTKTLKAETRTVKRIKFLEDVTVVGVAPTSALVCCCCCRRRRRPGFVSVPKTNQSLTNDHRPPFGCCCASPRRGLRRLWVGEWFLLLVVARGMDVGVLWILLLLLLLSWERCAWWGGRRHCSDNGWVMVVAT